MNICLPYTIKLVFTRRLTNQSTKNQVITKLTLLCLRYSYTTRDIQFKLGLSKRKLQEQGKVTNNAL